MSQALPPNLDPCMIAAGIPPAGTVTNFENPQTLVPVLISVCVLLVVLAVIFTACRIFGNRGKLWWSDYLVIVALILSLAHIGLIFTQTKYARHQWDTLFALEIISSFLLFFSKASILLLFHQLFEVNKPMRIAIRCGIAFTALLYIIANIPLSVIFTAPHAGETWAGILADRDPRTQLIWAIVQSVFGLGLDLFIFILPIPVILKLHLSTKQKIQLLAVFATAAIGVLASVLSLVYRVEALSTSDKTWAYTSLNLTNVVEADVAIIVSCTPGFANFARVYISRLGVFKPLRRGSDSGVNLQDDPNRPRTKKRFGRETDRSFSRLNDAYILQSSPSMEPFVAQPYTIRADGHVPGRSSIDKTGNFGMLPIEERRWGR
ncbi:hypothetical protein F5X98DRAFT_379304 [Xylaria grammica]|nr:hypothetical protein F5X98DRAFT_379304 [Xylaria grammica]